MALVVLAYPTIAECDRNWIEAIRSEHDLLYKDVVAAHFTLVFPVNGIEQTAFAEHIKQMTTGVPAFDFVLRCAVLADDVSLEHTHVFLVPDEGYSQIIKLHDRLYRALLEPEIRLDIPFIPHIGIGNDLDPKVCKGLADHLNAQNFEISGTIDWLDIARYENNRVQTVERIGLQPVSG